MYSLKKSKVFSGLGAEHMMPLIQKVLGLISGWVTRSNSTYRLRFLPIYHPDFPSIIYLLLWYD